MRVVHVLCFVLNPTQCFAEHLDVDGTSLADCLIGGNPVVRRGPYEYRSKGVRCELPGLYSFAAMGQ